MLILGSALVAGTLLLTALAALFFRRPDPPRWTRPDLVPMLVGVPLAGALALGLGYMGVGAYRLTSADALYQVPATLAVWGLAVVLWRLLDVRPRLRAYAAAERANIVEHPAVTAADGPTHGSEPPADPSHRHAA